MLHSMKFMAITTILNCHPTHKLCTLVVRVSRVAAVDHIMNETMHVFRFDVANLFAPFPTTRPCRTRLQEPTQRSHINPYW